MMNQRLVSISQTEAVNTIALFLKRVDVKARADEFLTDIQMSSGLLLEHEAGYWGFASLSFQEYLTAAHWLEEKVIAIDWSSMVDDSWWHETLLLYAAQVDATPIVKACLAVNTISAITLMTQLLEEAHELRPDVWQAAQNHLRLNPTQDGQLRKSQPWSIPSDG